MKKSNKIKPIHPGQVLAEDFLDPLGVTQRRLAKETHVAPRRIHEIVKGLRAVTADIALRFARYFGTTAAFWLNLQSRYDLEVAVDRLGGNLEKEIRPLPTRLST